MKDIITNLYVYNIFRGWKYNMDKGVCNIFINELLVWIFDDYRHVYTLTWHGMALYCIFDAIHYEVKQSEDEGEVEAVFTENIWTTWI